MLIDTIVDYCDKEYKKADTKHICRNCAHPSKCSGSCKLCLEQIHYPYKYQEGIKDYSCNNIINFYGCTYLYKYASELYYLIQKSMELKKIHKLHIMSIGCGAAPDLMAFEKYNNETDKKKTIEYVGFDMNERWKAIHRQIEYYAEVTESMKAKFRYKDVFEYLKEKYVPRVNVLVLQYVISHFYNTGQIEEIHDFFDELIAHIVKYKEQDNPLIILINDVNSCYRGRDYIWEFIDKLKEYMVEFEYQAYYFDYNIKNENQHFGKRQEDNRICFKIKDGLEQYQPWEKCSSAQMLIEVR